MIDKGDATAIKRFRLIANKLRKLDQLRARSRFSSAQFPKILIRDFTKCAPKRIRKLQATYVAPRVRPTSIFSRTL